MLGLREEDPRELGPYRLRAVIGDGGMGRVYLGTSPAGRAVAVKVIGPGLANQPGYRQRFAREASAALAVSGIYTASMVNSDIEGERPYIATEFVAAPSLADAVRTAGPLPMAAVFALAGGLAEALTAIHRAGLVHRDVKPHNILLAANGPVVIDFGIARGEEPSLTATGIMIGTPGYIAPEVLRGQHPTAASDIFSLACVLVHAARGTGPYGTGDPLSVAHRTVNEPPDLTGVPEPIRVLVTPLLERDPTLRPTPAQLVKQVSTASGTAVLHGGTWLPDSIKALLEQRQAEAQSILGEHGGRESPSGASLTPTLLETTAHTAYAPNPAAASYADHAAQALIQPPYPPATAPTAPMDRRRGGMFVAVGAVGTLVVVGAVATAIALTQHSSTPGAQNQSTQNQSRQNQGTQNQSTQNQSSSSHSATSPNVAAAVTPSSAASTAAVSYKPGTYAVNQTIAADLFGNTTTLQTITVDGDGSVAVKFTVLSAVYAEYTCAFSVPDEATLGTANGTVDPSTGSDCTKDPTKTWFTGPGQTWSVSEYFAHVPDGNGQWSVTLNTRDMKGSVSGVSIPTN